MISTYSHKQQSLGFSKMSLTQHFVKVLYQTDILCHLEGSIWVKMFIHVCSQLS